LPGKQAVPLRVRAKSSSFLNLSVTNATCRGCLIADVPAIVGSIDIVMGEIDRLSCLPEGEPIRAGYGSLAAHPRKATRLSGRSLHGLAADVPGPAGR
jgi:hypothetical protein